jgi:hypothetical protein
MIPFSYSRPRCWSLGNATLVVAKRSGFRRVLGVSKPRPSVTGAHPYRKRAFLETLRLATTNCTERGTGYPSWGHPTQLRISRGSKLDANSLTKTKNWSGRNEVTETSGRLHPLWQQSKWLHTPRTADYRHTGQDRWMQTELAFTLAKKTDMFGCPEVSYRQLYRARDWVSILRTPYPTKNLQRKQIGLIHKCSS